MIAAWSTAVIAASLRGGVALLLARIICALPRIPAAVRCWIWRAAYFLLIVSFLWTTPVQLRLLRAVQQTSLVALRSRVSLEAVAPKPAIVVPGESPYSVVESPRSHVSILMIAFVLWAAFFAGFLARLLIQWKRAQSLRSGQAFESKDAIELARTLDVTLPQLRTHPAVSGPLLLGVWRPMIVLPEPLPAAADFRLILAHELSHLRRRDLLWNWLPTIAFALLPWHPLVWIGSRRWRLASEAAADAMAIEISSSNASDYGRLLVNVATMPMAGMLSVSVLAESHWVLKQRLCAMAQITRWNRKRTVTTVVFVTAVTAIIIVPWHVSAQSPSSYRSPASTATESLLSTTTPVATGSHLVLPGDVVVSTSEIRSATQGVVTFAAVSGQKVRKGAVIAELDDITVEARVKAAEAKLTYAESDLARKKEQLAAAKSASGQDNEATLQSKLAEAQLALAQHELVQSELNEVRHDLALMQALAPFDGTIESVQVRPGDVVEFRHLLATEMQSGPLQVQCNIPQQYVGEIRVGTVVSVHQPDRSISLGKLIEVAPVLDPSTRTQRVTAQLTNEVPGLLPGMLVNVEFNPGDAAKPPMGVKTEADLPSPFAPGTKQFAPGDSITITSTYPTKVDRATGVIVVNGTYTLASHESATLAASITSDDPAGGAGPWTDRQQMAIKKGSGTFSLTLPTKIRGWPHVSFYDEHNSFGGVYFGTGEATLRDQSSPLGR